MASSSGAGHQPTARGHTALAPIRGFRPGTAALRGFASASPRDEETALATTTDTTTSATATVDATPAEVFAFLRDPANHPVISGDGSVRSHRGGPRELSQGDRFGMSMKLGVPYLISSKVVEFEPDRRIAWCHLGRHRWRWELEPTDDGRTRVTETFDMSTAVFPPALRALGYPRRHERNVDRSVANLAAHFAGA